MSPNRLKDLILQKVQPMRYLRATTITRTKPSLAVAQPNAIAKSRTLTSRAVSYELLGKTHLASDAIEATINILCALARYDNNFYSKLAVAVKAGRVITLPAPDRTAINRQPVNLSVTGHHPLLHIFGLTLSRPRSICRCSWAQKAVKEREVMGVSYRSKACSRNRFVTKRFIASATS